MRQIDDELEVLRSRIGGQGTGFGTSIDHNVVLDVMRNVDQYLEDEQELLEERRLCGEDVGAAWTLLNGVQHLGNEDMAYVLALHFIYLMEIPEIAKTTPYDSRVNKAMLDVALEWVDSVGVAKLKAETEYV